MPKINSLEVVHQDTNTDPYQNLHDILVDLNKSLALNKEVVDGTARAAIENLLELYANDKEAFLRSLTTLTATLDSTQAQLEEEIILRASAIEALARRTTTLSAKTASQFASVTEYAEAIASDVARKVSTYSQDTAPSGILSYGDLWYDTDDNKKLYRWNGVAWIATDDTRIATTYARWGVNVNANGHVAGVQLNSDNTGTSEFTVLADNFRVYKTGNLSDPMFDVGTVNGVTTVGIKGNLVVDGSIVTKGIGANATSVATSTVVGGTTATSATVNFTISGLATGETVPVHISTGLVADASCGMATYIDSTRLSLDSYTANHLAYIGSAVALGNGTYSASLSTDLVSSNNRRLSIQVIVSKR